MLSFELNLCTTFTIKSYLSLFSALKKNFLMGLKTFSILTIVRISDNVSSDSKGHPFAGLRKTTLFAGIVDE